LVLPIEATALEAAAAAAAAEAAAAAAAGGTRGCGLRAMVAVCNGFVELRATTLTFVLPVRVGLDTVVFEAAAGEAVRAGLAAVEGLRGFGLVAGGDVVPAVVHVEGSVGVSVGGGGDDAGVVVVGGVVVGSGSLTEPITVEVLDLLRLKSPEKYPALRDSISVVFPTPLWPKTFTLIFPMGVVWGISCSMYSSQQESLFSRFSKSLISPWPCDRAASSGVTPSLFLTSIRHPARHRHRTTSV